MKNSGHQKPRKQRGQRNKANHHSDPDQEDEALLIFRWRGYADHVMKEPHHGE